MSSVTFTPEYLSPPIPVAPGICEELGRVTRAYVSGYQRTRVHASRIVRGEKRCLVANFNGAIAPSLSIVSAIWRTNQNGAVYMADASIDATTREVRMTITAQWGGPAVVKCEATLNNGEVYTQLFNISIMQSPWFTGETVTSSGPTSLTVTA